MEELLACPVCDSGKIVRVYEFDTGYTDDGGKKIKVYDNEKGFEFRLCVCGAAYLSPRMIDEEQYEYYGSGTYRAQIAEKISDEREISLQKARAQVVSQQIKAFDIRSHLDVGCSTGELLRAVADGKGKKFRSVGVDPDPKWPGEVKVLYKRIEEVEGKFDLITLIQVLEHLNKPQDMMNKIKDRLSPGGLVVVEVPNRRCYMTAYDAPKHVVAYDLLSLGRLMVKVGLVVVDFELQDYLHDGPLDMYISMLATNNKELCDKRCKEVG